MSTCLIPFNQLYIHSSGDVYPCSFVQNNPDFVLGNIQQASLATIWEGEKAAALREKHLGVLPGACERNQSTFLCNKTGVRSHFHPSDLKLRRLDVMLDSACNLTCVMCTNIYDKNGGFKENFFWENNDDMFSTIVEVELVGGEPLISPYFFRIVDRISALNPKCQWSLTTNAHYPITEKLIQTLDKMHMNRLSISLDSLKPEVFEKIRQRSQFQIVYDNIFNFKKLIPQIQINMVVQDSNYHELMDMVKWTQDQGFFFHPILLVHPDKHSISQLPRQEMRSWILETMARNEILKDRETIFFLKKAMNLFNFQKDLEVIDAYLRQLKLVEKAHV